MKSDFFIDRPVFSTVLSVIIVIVGVKQGMPFAAQQAIRYSTENS